jgi:hypothetical protein
VVDDRGLVWCQRQHQEYSQRERQRGARHNYVLDFGLLTVSEALLRMEHAAQQMVKRFERQCQRGRRWDRDLNNRINRLGARISSTMRCASSNQVERRAFREYGELVLAIRRCTEALSALEENTARDRREAESSLAEVESRYGFCAARMEQLEYTVLELGRHPMYSGRRGELLRAQMNEMGQVFWSLRDVKQEVTGRVLDGPPPPLYASHEASPLCEEGGPVGPRCLVRTTIPDTRQP